MSVDQETDMNKVRGAALLGALTLLAVVASLPVSAQQQAPVMDISGMWNHNNLMTEDRAVLINAVGGGAKIGDYTGFPLNDAGRQYADSWMEARIELPEHQCHPHPTQYSLWGPGNFRLTNVLDPLTDRIIGLRLEGTFGRADRVIWLDGRPHPSEYARHTWAGFSTGVFEGNMLTVETTHLREGWFNRNGITSSDRTTMREHFIRHDNYMTVVFILNDPEHLDEPFIRTTQAVYDPTTTLTKQECQPFNTAVINADQKRGTVPHWLPGQNPQLREFGEKYGVPYEATRGGAQTTYPEYMAVIKKWVTDKASAVTSSK
jgi:hypothetical protein